MTAKTQAALGFRAERGGSVVVGVALEKGEPRVVLSTFLKTAEADDRLAFEPYHVAAEMAGGVTGEILPEIAAAVAEGRKRQIEQAAKNLDATLRQVRGLGFEPAIAVLLVNRAGWITDLLQHALSMPEHPPVIEGLAVRETLRAAFSGAGLHFVETDEKSLFEQGASVLGLPPDALEPRLKALGAAVKPWRKEQKLACLAGWETLIALK